MSYQPQSGMRFRQKLVQQRTSDAYVVTKRPAYPSSDNTYSFGTQRVSYESEHMYDVVIKDFHRLSAEGAIFNNPMYTESIKETTPLASYTYLTGVGTDDPITYAFKRRPWCPTLPSQMLDHEDLIDLALTAAYANVSANEGNTLLWLGEFKETVKMLFDIGNQLHKLYKATEKARKQWAKGKLSVEAQQQLTLSILYGILPLEESIAQFMEGLFRTKPDGRHTARGFQVKTSTKDLSHDGSIPFFSGSDVLERVQYVEMVETTVRAGVLTDVDYSEVPWLAMIADPKSVVSTAYALARLSFVIDWFINVGNTLAAWSPSAGTTELAAWVTVEQTVTVTGVSQYVIPSKRTDIAVSGNGSFDIQKRIKYRQPMSRADLAILPRFTLDLDLSKISALVLLFAKVKK